MNTILKINNYKCFEHQDIVFKNLTVLAGANSAGKSSVIQALLLSRSGIDRLKGTQQFNTVLNWAGQLSIPLNNVYKLALGTAEAVLARDKTEEADAIRFSFLENENEFKVELAVLLEHEDKFALTMTNCQNKTRIGSNPISILSNEFYYLNAERKGPRLSHEIGSLDFLHTGYEGEYSMQVFHNQRTTPVESSRLYNDERPTYSHQVPLWMNFITPGVEVSVPNVYEKVKTAEIAINRNTPTNVGFGVSYVLPIVLNGLLAKKGTMFIVENPEAHLHPAGQSRIGYFLAKVAAAGVQVVIETHSEHVINGIRIATLDEKVAISPNEVLINFFTKHKNSSPMVQPINITESGDLSKFPRDFFDQTLQDMGTIVKLKRQRK